MQKKDVSSESKKIYVSEEGKLLQQLNARDDLVSEARDKEVKKYKRIHALRDNIELK